MTEAVTGSASWLTLSPAFPPLLPSPPFQGDLINILCAHLCLTVFPGTQPVTLELICLPKPGFLHLCGSCGNTFPEAGDEMRPVRTVPSGASLQAEGVILISMFTGRSLLTGNDSELLQGDHFCLETCTSLSATGPRLSL